MKRRTFLTGAAGAAAASKLAAPTLAQGTQTLRLATSWSAGTPGFHDGSVRFAAEVAALSGGRLKVEIVPGGDGKRSAFDAVQFGEADMYHGMESDWRAKVPVFDAFTGLPFGMTASEHDAWLAEGGGQALWDELSGAFGLKCLPCGNTGGQMGGWYRAEIPSLDGFKGRKIRAAGLAAEVLKRVGAVPLTVPGDKLVASLNNLEADGVEWLGPWHDMHLGLQNATKFYYFPGSHAPAAALSLGIGRKLWNALSAGDKALLTAAAAAAHKSIVTEFDAKNADALQQLRFKEAVRALKLPDDVLEAMGGASGQVVREMASGGDKLTKKIVASYIAFRSKAIAWSRVSDQAFRNARLLAFDY